MSKEKTERTSGLAIAGLIIGILALILSWVPIINNFAFVLAVLGFIFGVIGWIGIRKGKRVGQGLAIATVIISLVSFGMVLASQAMYGKAIDDVSKAVDNSTKNANGDNTGTILKKDLDVSLGKFSDTKDQYGLDTTSLPVTVKNKSGSEASYSVTIKAVNKSGVKIDDDTLYFNNLKAGESASDKAFQYVSSDDITAMQSATFKVSSVSKY